MLKVYNIAKNDICKLENSKCETVINKEELLDVVKEFKLHWREEKCQRTFYFGGSN